MTSDISSTALSSLMTTIHALRHQSRQPRLSPTERAARVSSLVDRLSASPMAAGTAYVPAITRNAEDR